MMDEAAARWRMQRGRRGSPPPACSDASRSKALRSDALLPLALPWQAGARYEDFQASRQAGIANKR